MCKKKIEFIDSTLLLQLWWWRWRYPFCCEYYESELEKFCVWVPNIETHTETLVYVVNGKSTLVARVSLGLNRFYNYVLWKLSHNRIVCVVYPELSRAFNTVTRGAHSLTQKEMDILKSSLKFSMCNMNCGRHLVQKFFVSFPKGYV